MLTLTWKKGERIAIGNDVFITCVDVGGGKGRVGIDAPRDRPIVREALLPPEQMQAIIEAAAKSNG